MDRNPIGWVEIPVADMDRAIAFYEDVFQFKIQRGQIGPLDMGWFPGNQEQKGCSGSLVKHDSYMTSETIGALIHFSSANVANELVPIESTGGKVVEKKTLISEEIGYSGMFIDSEGNRIALHSRK